MGYSLPKDRLEIPCGKGEFAKTRTRCGSSYFDISDDSK